MLLDLSQEYSGNEYCPTTTDNPWNPFTQFDEWLAYDNANGYHTLERWARMRRTLAIASRVDDEDMVAEEAIDELVRLSPYPTYTKVTKDTDCKKLSALEPAIS